MSSPSPVATDGAEINPFGSNKTQNIKEVLLEEICDEKLKIHAISPSQENTSELEEKIRKLETLLYHWQTSANDANDRLRRLSLQKGEKNSADIFYDSSVKRVMEELIVENNHLLKICTKSAFNEEEAVKIIELEKRIQDLENNVKNLRQELEVKFRQNQKLQKLMSDSEKPEADKKLLSENANNLAKISYLTKENTKLKTYLLQKHNLMEYLKDLFEKMKDDLVKLFVKHVREDEDFLKQLKSDESEIPEFLLKPLVRHQETMTIDESIVKPKIPDEGRCDSGIASFTEKDAQYMEELKLERSHSQKLRSEIETSRTRFSSIQIKLSEVNNELESWRTALKQSQDDVSQLQRENDDLKDDRKTKEVIIFNLNKVVQQDTIALMKELGDAKEKIKQLEDINRNLHSKISSPPKPRKKTAFSDTQVGQGSFSGYPAASSGQYHEYGMQQPKPRELPREPWQSSWYPPHMGGLVTVAADGATKRDTIIENEDISTSKPSVSSPSQQFSEAPPLPRRTPAEIMGGLGRSLQDKLYQCDTCKNHYPSSLIWQHMRTCSNPFEEDD